MWIVDWLPQPPLPVARVDVVALAVDARIRRKAIAQLHRLPPATEDTVLDGLPALPVELAVDRLVGVGCRRRAWQTGNAGS